MLPSTRTVQYIVQYRVRGTRSRCATSYVVHLLVHPLLYCRAPLARSLVSTWRTQHLLSVRHVARAAYIERRFSSASSCVCVLLGRRPCPSSSALLSAVGLALLCSSLLLLCSSLLLLCSSAAALLCAPLLCSHSARSSLLFYARYSARLLLALPLLFSALLGALLWSRTTTTRTLEFALHL